MKVKDLIEYYEKLNTGERSRNPKSSKNSGVDTPQKNEEPDNNKNDQRHNQPPKLEVDCESSKSCANGQNLPNDDHDRSKTSEKPQNLEDQVESFQEVDQLDNLSTNKKLLMSLKKITPTPIDAVDEVNMFKDDGSVIHFKNPSVLFSPQSQGFTIAGANDHKKISEIPQVLNQLGLEGLKAWAASAQTRDILSNMSNQQAGSELAGKQTMGLSGDVPDFEADDVE